MEKRRENYSLASWAKVFFSWFFFQEQKCWRVGYFSFFTSFSSSQMDGWMDDWGRVSDSDWSCGIIQSISHGGKGSWALPQITEPIHPPTPTQPKPTHHPSSQAKIMKWLWGGELELMRWTEEQ